MKKRIPAVLAVTVAAVLGGAGVVTATLRKVEVISASICDGGRPE